MARSAALVIAVAACSAPAAPPHATLYPAGTEKDDGYGELAHQSAHLATSDDAPAFAAHHHRGLDGAPFGGEPYAGAYVDDSEPSINDGIDAARLARKQVYASPREETALASAIAGTIRWLGPPPPALTTACGTIDHPGVRIHRGAVAGALVYLEHVQFGRALPAFDHPAIAGGVIVKHGCTLAPSLQIVSPLPTGISIYGDAGAVVLQIAAPEPPFGQSHPPSARTVMLEAAARLTFQAQPGVTRIDAADGSLAPAWVVASDSPYYAITDDDGQFRLDELGRGTYDVTIVRPPVASVSHGKLSYGPPVVVHRTVTLGAHQTARLDVGLAP